MRDHQLLHGPSPARHLLREPVGPPERPRQEGPELVGGPGGPEQVEQLSLEPADERRRVVPAAADPSELELPVLVEAVVAVRYPEPVRDGREEDDPAVPPLVAERQVGPLAHLSGERLRVGRLVRVDRREPERVDDPVDDAVPCRLGRRDETGEQFAGVGVDRLVALDPSEAGVPVPLVAERGHEDPLQHLDASDEARPFLGRERRVLRGRLVGETPGEERLERAGDEADLPRARAVAEPRRADRAVRAAPALERLRREVLPDHDVGEEAGEVELVHRSEDPDRRDEDHAPSVRGDQAVRPSERLGPVLLPRDVDPTAKRLRHFHRRETGPRRLPDDRGEREPREPGRVDEPREVRVAEEERILPVEMEPSGKRVGRRAVEDLSVRLERAGGPGGPEPGRFPAEEELLRPEPDGRGPAVEPRQVERIPPVGEEDVRVRPSELADERAEQVLLGPVQRRVAEADRGDPSLRRWQVAAMRSLEGDPEPGDAQRRELVVDGLRRLGGPDRRATTDDGGERIEPVRKVVELRGGEVDVEELVPDEPAHLVDRPGEGAAGGVAGRDDLEDRPWPTVEDRRTEDDLPHPVDARTAAQAREELVQVAPSADDEERWTELDRGAVDPAAPAVLHPENDRAAVPALRDVEEPSLRRGRAPHGRQRRGGRVNSSGGTRRARSRRTERRIDSRRSGLPTYVAWAT